DLGQTRVITVSGTGRGIHERTHLCVARSHEHVQEATDVHFIGGDRIFERTGNRTERCLVQHMVDTLGRATAHLEIPYVAFDELEAGPRVGAHVAFHLIEVVLVPRGEV